MRQSVRNAEMLREAAHRQPLSSPQEESPGILPPNGMSGQGCVCIIKVKDLDLDLCGPGCSVDATWLMGWGWPSCKR